MEVALTAKWVLPITSKPIHNGAVIIKGKNIEAVGEKEDVLSKYPYLEVNDLANALIMPGLVNLHTHLELTILKGKIPEELGFTDWIMRLVRERMLLGYNDYLTSAEQGIRELIRTGTTCVAEITSLGASFEALKKSGLRGIVYLETLGVDNASADSVWQETKTKLNNLLKEKNDILEMGISPHSPYSVSPKLFQKVKQYTQKNNLRLCIHTAESVYETQYIQNGQGEIAEKLLQAVCGNNLPHIQHSNTPVEYLAKLGLLNNYTLLVHAVQVMDDDLKQLAKADCAIAHCPRSNAFLGVGIAPLGKFWSSNLKVGLGTDSLASNGSLNLWDEMRFAFLLHRANSGETNSITAEKILKMATIDGAKALGLEDKIGSLEKGKKADIIAINSSDINRESNLYYDLLFDSEAMVTMSMVDGEIIRKGFEGSRSQGFK